MFLDGNHENVNISVLPKLIHKFNMILIKILLIFMKLSKHILKPMCK